MSIETEEPFLYHRRKARQAWEMAGLARMDNDGTDARRHTKDAREHDAYVRILQRGEPCPCPKHVGGR